MSKEFHEQSGELVGVEAMEEVPCFEAQNNCT